MEDTNDSGKFLARGFYQLKHFSFNQLLNVLITLKQETDLQNENLSQKFCSTVNFHKWKGYFNK